MDVLCCREGGVVCQGQLTDVLMSKCYPPRCHNRFFEGFDADDLAWVAKTSYVLKLRPPRPPLELLHHAIGPVSSLMLGKDLAPVDPKRPE